MFGRDQRRNVMNVDYQSGLEMLSGAAGHFAGAMLNELGRRSQPPPVPQQPHTPTRRSHESTGSGHQKPHRVCEMNVNYQSGLEMLSGTAGHFAGAMLNELGRRSQPAPKKPHISTRSSHVSTGSEYEKRHRKPKACSGEQADSNSRKDHRVSACNKRARRPHAYVMPYIHKTGHLKPNDIIFIYGVPRPKATRFTVYLQNGDKFQPSLITFCFDVRFSYGNGRNSIIRNHKDGRWGMEERQIGYFPFRTGEHFEMIILVEQGCFKVAVNNNHILQFNHRIRQLDRADTLCIDGDVTLTQVRIQT